MDKLEKVEQKSRKPYILQRVVGINIFNNDIKQGSKYNIFFIL